MNDEEQIQFNTEMMRLGYLFKLALCMYLAVSRPDQLAFVFWASLFLLFPMTLSQKDLMPGTLFATLRPYKFGLSAVLVCMGVYQAAVGASPIPLEWFLYCLFLIFPYPPSKGA